MSDRARRSRSALPDVLPGAVCVLDTETTGLGRDARIVEIAVIALVDGEIQSEWSTLVDPETHIPREVVRIHGITDRMVRGAPTANVALTMLRRKVVDNVVVAHNASFDLRMLAQDCERTGQPAPIASVDGRVLCTMRLARRAFPEVGGYGLARLVSALEISARPAHRAIADARATAELYERIRQRWSERLP